MTCRRCSAVSRRASPLAPALSASSAGVAPGACPLDPAPRVPLAVPPRVPLALRLPAGPARSLELLLPAARSARRSALGSVSLVELLLPPLLEPPVAATRPLKPAVPPATPELAAASFRRADLPALAPSALALSGAADPALCRTFAGALCCVCSAPAAGAGAGTFFGTTGSSAQLCSSRFRRSRCPIAPMSFWGTKASSSRRAAMRAARAPAMRLLPHCPRRSARGAQPCERRVFRGRPRLPLDSRRINDACRRSVTCTEPGLHRRGASQHSCTAAQYTGE